jgi:hypothetical protein
LAGATKLDTPMSASSAGPLVGMATSFHTKDPATRKYTRMDNRGAAHAGPVLQWSVGHAASPAIQDGPEDPSTALHLGDRPSRYHPRGPVDPRGQRAHRPKRSRGAQGFTELQGMHGCRDAGPAADVVASKLRLIWVIAIVSRVACQRLSQLMPCLFDSPDSEHVVGDDKETEHAFPFA